MPINSGDTDEGFYIESDSRNFALSILVDSRRVLLSKLVLSDSRWRSFASIPVETSARIVLVFSNNMLVFGRAKIMSSKRQWIFVVVIAVICAMGAIPYGADLACVYVRDLDTRDEIDKGIAFPPNDWAQKFGGLSERVLVMGNLTAIPQLHSDNEALKKQLAAQERRLAMMEDWQKKQLRMDLNDPNSAKSRGGIDNGI